MKTLKVKCMALLMTIACFFICFGAVTVAHSSYATVTASAETVYTITKLAPLNTSTQSVLNVYPLVGDKLSVNSWDYRFTLEAGTGKGFALNGVTFTPTEMKQPGTDLYINLGKTAKANDVLTIDGTYFNAEAGAKIVFKNCGLKYNGSAWETHTVTEEVATYNVGKLTPNTNSTVAGKASTRADHLYTDSSVYPAASLPVRTWDSAFTLVSGKGVLVDGVALKSFEMKSAPEGIWFGISNVKTNSVVTIEGTFHNATEDKKYVIEESKFLWTGSVWQAHADRVTHEVGSLVIAENSSSTAVYFKRADGKNFPITEGTWTEKLTFLAGSGVGVTVNGKQINMGDIKIPNNIYVGLGMTAKANDVLVIGGTFYNNTLGVAYVIKDSTFTWSGKEWTSSITEDQLAYYDKIGVMDLGLAQENVWEGVVNESGRSFFASEQNTTNSVELSFVYNSTNTSSGEFTIRLRGSAWTGFHFTVRGGRIATNNSGASYGVALANNRDYLIEIGAIDTTDGQSVWTYIRVDGVLVANELLAKSAKSATESGNPTFGSFNTNHVSIYANVQKTTLKDTKIKLTYQTTAGSFCNYVNPGDCVLPTGRTYAAFIGWLVNGQLYEAGATIPVSSAMTITALEVDFRMEKGASIRIGEDANSSGIRFIIRLNEADLQALAGYGITELGYGTLIFPYDDLAAGQAPNLEQFTADTEILKIPSTKQTKEGEDIVYCGAMEDLYEENYERLFAGRGYLQFTLNGKQITVYTPFDKKDNVRSIRAVSQAFMADDSEATDGRVRYNTLSDLSKEVVQNYAAVNTIDLMEYATYAANNFLNVIAWNYPKLDESNGYNNAANVAIAKQMKDAGIKVVNLTGENLLLLKTKENIEKTRKIIEFFWSQGLQTVAFAGNTTGYSNGSFENMNVDFTQTGTTPDFSDCEGFIGFLHWDEPTDDDIVMAKLADLAMQFDSLYAGTGVTFMVNLFPSEWSGFGGKQNNYKSYLEEYCQKVLSKIHGEKWLSVDSYPIMKDYSLVSTFLFDVAMVKQYSLQYDAQSHMALQSSGWSTSDSDGKSRIPTEAEMRMQAYAAMAFGIDSISWFSYSPSSSGSESFFTPVDSNGNAIENGKHYEALKKVNNELAAVGPVYSAFEWKGVILGIGSWFNNSEYSAYNMVKNHLDAKYQLSAASTKNLSSVSTSGSLNYLMSVMEDAHGNEGYVLCNYNNHKSNRAQTLTINFSRNVTEVVVYRGGVATTISVSNKKLTIDLATGEGVIVLPAKLG